MKIIFLMYIITLVKGSSLWSISSLSNSDMNFFVNRDGGSVHIEAFIRDPVKNIKFFIFTRNKPQGIQLQINDRSTLLMSGFDFNMETKLLIHGFANSASSEFNNLLKNAYLEHKYNVIIVDWSELCEPPFYPSAVDNAQKVGTHAAQILAWLVSEGVSLSHLHIVGHSVGAHIAGVAGRHLRHLGHIGRITGLDPAKPMFELETDDNRLSSDDADFVDCIYTCGGFLGMSEPTCSVNFYPNGGTNPQPGCTLDIFGSCSHQRAYLYFWESIAQPKSFEGVRCLAVENYSPVNCSLRYREVMGEHTNNKSHGIFYLATAHASPFSLKETSLPGNSFTNFFWYFS